MKSPEGCLKLYPQPIWLELRARLLALPQDAAAWRRFLLGSAQDIELDGAGRFLIAPELRSFAKLQRDLKFMGVGSHFELWDAQVHALITRPPPWPRRCRPRLLNSISKGLIR